MIKAYTSYKKSGIEWVGKIPMNWSKVKLGRSFDLIGSGTTPKSSNRSYYSKGEINWLNTGDLNDSYITKTKKKITQKALDDFSTLKLFPEGSVVIALYGATIGKLGHLKIKTSTNQACCVLSESKTISNRFLFYFLLHSREHIISLAYGGGQPNISQDIIKQLYIPAPPLQEQTQIAKYLDYQTNIIDQLIEKKEKLVTLLQEQRQAIINEAVTKGIDPNAKMKDSGIEWLGEIPEEWAVFKLKYLVEMQSGKSITSNSIEDEGDYPVFGGNGKRGFSDNYTNDGEFVLIGRQGALCGNINYASGKFWASEHAVVVYPKVECDIFYLGELLRIMNLNQYSEAAAQPGISVTKILNLYIPKISYELQKQISIYIKDRTTVLDSVILRTKASILKLKEYRQSIISEAVTGKIDLRDWKTPKKESV